jgi:hypothetical protein
VRQLGHLEPGARDGWIVLYTPRHQTHSKPSFLEWQCHPMTWRQAIQQCPLIHPSYTPHKTLIQPLHTPHTPLIHPSYTPHTPPIHPSYTPHTPLIHPSYTPHTPLIHPSHTPHAPLVHLYIPYPVVRSHTRTVWSDVAHARRVPSGRGLHLFTFQLNLNAFCGTGGACRGCLGGV